MTVMPNLRLSWNEARDIASYLMTLKHADAAYPSAAFLERSEAERRRPQEDLVLWLRGLPRISGLEEEGRIGTELTIEGSKPLEQMDFALFVREAESEGWHNPKGFFEHKLAQPEMYDKGMIKTEAEQLHMPDFFEPVSSKVTKGALELSPDAQHQVSQLTTFLLGSVSRNIPRDISTSRTTTVKTSRTAGGW